MFVAKKSNTAGFRLETAIDMDCDPTNQGQTYVELSEGPGHHSASYFSVDICFVSWSFKGTIRPPLIFELGLPLPLTSASVALTEKLTNHSMKARGSSIHNHGTGSFTSLFFI